MTPMPNFQLDSVCFITIISKQIFGAIPTWICIFCLHVGKKFRERLQENNIHTHWRHSSQQTDWNFAGHEEEHEISCFFSTQIL